MKNKCSNCVCFDHEKTVGYVCLRFMKETNHNNSCDKWELNNKRAFE